MLNKALIIGHYCEKFNTNYDTLAWVLKFASIISQVKFVPFEHADLKKELKICQMFTINMSKLTRSIKLLSKHA
jgi:hypothetical protein